MSATPLLPVDARRIVAFLSAITHGEDTECWLWTGPANVKGYGFWSTANENAHRTAYRWFVDSSLRDDQDVHHVCGTKLCVNPKHLRALTRAEHAACHVDLKEIVCKKGHEIGPRNMRLEKWRGRVVKRCAICHRLKNRRLNRQLRERLKQQRHESQATA